MQIRTTTKEYCNLIVCGSVDSGKSITCAHLLSRLGGISKSEMNQLYEMEQEKQKYNYHGFGFYDWYYRYIYTSNEDRYRGTTLQCKTKEFFTEKYHYTIIDTPGHRDYIKNMITGTASTAAAGCNTTNTVGLLIVPADPGGFEAAIAPAAAPPPPPTKKKKKRTKTNMGMDEKDDNQDEDEYEIVEHDHDHNDNHNEEGGQCRMFARLLYLFGVQNIIVGVNKMDACNWSESRFYEIQTKIQTMLQTIGFKPKRIPIVPYSGLHGDNLFEKMTKTMTIMSDNNNNKTSSLSSSSWYKGWVANINPKTKVTGFTLLDCLDHFVASRAAATTIAADTTTTTAAAAAAAATVESHHNPSNHHHDHHRHLQYLEKLPVRLPISKIYYNVPNDNNTSNHNNHKVVDLTTMPTMPPPPPPRTTKMILSGTLVQGTLKPGDEISILSCSPPPGGLNINMNINNIDDNNDDNNNKKTKKNMTIISMESHKRPLTVAVPGDFVSLFIDGIETTVHSHLDNVKTTTKSTSKKNKHKSTIHPGDIIHVQEREEEQKHLKRITSFTATVYVYELGKKNNNKTNGSSSSSSSSLKAGQYSPVIFCGTNKVACKMTKILWKQQRQQQQQQRQKQQQQYQSKTMTTSTTKTTPTNNNNNNTTNTNSNNNKIEKKNPLELYPYDYAEVEFVPVDRRRSLYVERFCENQHEHSNNNHSNNNCFGRIAVMDSNQLKMIGKVTSTSTAASTSTTTATMSLMTHTKYNNHYRNFFYY